MELNLPYHRLDMLGVTGSSPVAPLPSHSDCFSSLWRTLYIPFPPPFRVSTVPPVNAPAARSVPWIVAASEPEVCLPPEARTLAGFRAEERNRVGLWDYTLQAKVLG